jgi:hypothetical protein
MKLIFQKDTALQPEKLAHAPKLPYLNSLGLSLRLGGSGLESPPIHPRARSGNRQSAQAALECSQKSRGPDFDLEIQT